MCNYDTYPAYTRGSIIRDPDHVIVELEPDRKSKGQCIRNIILYTVIAMKYRFTILLKIHQLNNNIKYY